MSGAVTLKPIESRLGTTVVMPEATKVPETYNLSDSVLATVMEVSLDTDSDNNGTIDLGWKEKSLKNKDGRPGKFVRANIRDQNANLLVDYADLTNAATSDFVTGRFYLNTPYPLSDLRVKFIYNGASSLSGFPNPDVEVETIEEYASLRTGDIRLWVDWTPTQTNADGTEHRRDPANYTGENNATGNYLPPNVTFTADKLFKTYASNKSGTQTFYVEGLNGGPSNVIVEVYYKDGRLLGKDEIKFTVTDLELRANNMNDKPNTFGGWNSSFKERLIQSRIGKMVENNVFDLDENGVEDYKDSGITETAVRLVPMLLTLSENDVFDDLWLCINYAGATSAPAATDGPGESPLRIWVAEQPSKVLTRNFSNFSGYRSSLEEGENYVDYLQPGKYYRAREIMKTGVGGYKVLLWVESVADFSTTIVSAELGYVDPDAEEVPPPAPQSAPALAAARNAAAQSSTNSIHSDIQDLIPVNDSNNKLYQFNLSIDSDNNGVLGRLNDEYLEDGPRPDSGSNPTTNGTAGKVIPVNNLDTDYDGIPDFASGYNIKFDGVSQLGNGKSKMFPPMSLKFPDDLDRAKATLTFTYSQAAPEVGRSGTGTITNPWSYATSGGKLRIWKKNGNSARYVSFVPSEGSSDNSLDTYDGIGDFFANGVTIPVSEFGTSNPVTLYVEAVTPSGAPGDITITAKLSMGGNAVNSEYEDSVKATAVKVNAITPTGEPQKVLIATDRNFEPTDGLKGYYFADQTEDRKVKVTATVTPALPDIPVFLEVIDPDDCSPYEGITVSKDGNSGTTNTDPNDNRDSVLSLSGTNNSSKYAPFQNAAFETRSPLTNAAGVADTVLTVTALHSGDNYAVRATCQSTGGNPFDSNSAVGLAEGAPVIYTDVIGNSATLVAWKRYYIEYSRMYAKSATITFMASSTANQVTVDNTDAFINLAPLTSVIIFLSDGTEFECKISSVSGNTITFEAPLGKNVHALSGVRVKGYDEYVWTLEQSALNNEDYMIPQKETYGNLLAGTDGGAFIEFKEILRKDIPFYKTLTYLIISNFTYCWQKYSGPLTIHLIASGGSYSNEPDTAGISFRWESYAYVFAQVCNEYNYRRRTIPHETGHLLSLRNNSTHIDQNINWPNHANNGKCIMTYYDHSGQEPQPDGTSKTIEFCIDCLYTLRAK